MHLQNGVLWPIPINLSVSAQISKQIGLERPCALRDNAGRLLALMDMTDRWQPDKGQEAQAVFGTTQLEHPGVAGIKSRNCDTYLGGRLIGITMPQQLDFFELR